MSSRFHRLLVATGASSVGDGMVLVAFPLVALHFTHNPVLVAGVALAARLPALLFGLPAGVLADRWSRRLLAVGAQLVRLAALGILAGLLLVGAGSLVAIYATAFVLGCMEEVYEGATFASLPEIVRANQLDRANSQLTATQLAAEQIAGQGVGGLALAVGRALPFFADAGSFAIGAAVVARAIPAHPPVVEQRPSIRSQLVEGLRWFGGHPVLPVLAALIGSFAFCQFMMMGIVVLYARVTLHLSSAAYGYLMAGAAVGNVVGALVASRVAARLGAVSATLLAGGVAGVAYLGMGWQRSVLGLAGFLVVENLAVPVGIVASIGLRQRLIPNELLGRVGMVFRVIIFTATPLGALTGGALARGMPFGDVFLAAGVLQLVMLGALAPRLWRRATPDDLVIDLNAAEAQAPSPSY
ncbi:MAG: MFS transporter [Acidimicrobiales bacterium]